MKNSELKTTSFRLPVGFRDKLQAKKEETGMSLGSILEHCFNQVYGVGMTDTKRLDWLSDTNNKIGNVTLPTSAVRNNISDMRAAIDEAMTYEQ